MPVEDLTEEEVMNAVTIGLTGITVRLLTCFLFTARADFFLCCFRERNLWIRRKSSAILSLMQ